jgi:hypothetical protein
VADDDPAFSEEVLYVTKAEMEAKVQPHGMRDDLGREAIASVPGAVGRGRNDGHQATLIAHRRST